MRKSKKKLRYIAIVLALIFLPIGAFTLGYFFKIKSENHKVAHTLSVDGSINGSITQDIAGDVDGIVPGDEVAVTVNIKPTSSADSLLRVKIEPYWSNGDKGKSLSADNIEIIYANNSVKNDMSNGSWYKHGEYLYYMGNVNNSTDNLELVKGIKFLATGSENTLESYQNKDIHMKVTMDMVQCSDYAYTSKWSEANITGSLADRLNSFCQEGKKISGIMPN